MSNTQNGSAILYKGEGTKKKVKENKTEENKKMKSTETPPQKHRLSNRPRGVENPAGNPKPNKRPENPQKLRDPAPT